jgi:cytochrome P450
MNGENRRMNAMTKDVAAGPDVATPTGAGGLLARLFSGPRLPALAARIGAATASALGRPIRVGSRVIAARHADVTEALARDLDFRIAPINATRIEAVNGPFVLGMDRGCTLARERAALYRALAQVDFTTIRAAVGVNAAQRLDAAAASGTIDVVGDYARPIAAETAHALFGIRGMNETLFMDVARAIFAHTFLNLSDDKVVEARALRAAPLMHGWFADEIARRRAAGLTGPDMMGALMRDTTIDDDGVRRTLGGMLVGSIDTTASAVAKIVSTIGRDRTLAARVAADAADETRLDGWCLEALRRWPHNPIVLRQAENPTTFGSVAVQAGDQVVVWTQAAMLDASVFPSPGELRPDRPAARYLHFGGGLHPCAGRVVNDFQIPMLVGALFARGVTSVGRVGWAGPFPNHLSVHMKRTSP